MKFGRLICLLSVCIAGAAGAQVPENPGNALFYLPTRDEPTTPAAWNLAFESVKFPSTAGTTLHGWFIPARVKSAKATVVFSHGNAGSMGYHLGFCAWLAEARYNVFIYDYRGFGKSTGNVERRGMIDDVKAAFKYVQSRSDVDASRLVSVGHSLGGAQTVTALAESPVKGVRAIITDGAFASYRAMAGLVAGQLGESLVSDELAPKDYIGRLPHVPLLMVHGTLDEVVPIAQGRQLFTSAAEPKTFFEVKRGRHGTALSDNNGAYRKKLLVWLADVLKAPSER